MDLDRISLHFYYSDFSRDPTEYTSLEYLEEYINKIQDEKNTSLSETYERNNIRGLIAYDVIVCEYNILPKIEEFEDFKKMINFTIMDYGLHHNRRLRDCGIRLAYLCPSYFQNVDIEDFYALADKLITWAIDEKETEKTLIMQCLQGVIYRIPLLGARVYKLESLYNSLIEQIQYELDLFLSNSNEVSPKGNNRTEQSHDHDASIMDDHFVELSISKISNLTNPTDSEMSIFHKMILLNYIVRCREPFNIPDTTGLALIMKKCMSQSTNSFESLMCVAFRIIYDGLHQMKILNMFMENEFIKYLVKVDQKLYCWCICLSLLNKIALNHAAINKIFYIQNNYFLQTISFALNPESKYECADVYTYLLHILKYQEVFQIFMRLNGISILFRMFERCETIQKMKTNAEMTDNGIENTIDKKTKSIEEILKFILVCSLISIWDTFPKGMKDDIPIISIIDNYSLKFELIMSYLKAFGGIDYKVDIFEQLILPENFKIIIMILYIVCVINTSYDNCTFRLIWHLLRILSLYHGALPAFCSKFSFYPQFYENNHNMCNILKWYICENTNYQKYVNALPLLIYENLIETSVGSKKKMKELLKGDIIYEYNEYSRDCANYCMNVRDIFEQLIQNGVLFQIMRLCYYYMKNACEDESAISIVRLLCYLSLMDHYIKILSAQTTFLDVKLIQTIIMLVQNNQMYQHKFLKYSWILCRRITLFSNGCTQTNFNKIFGLHEFLSYFATFDSAKVFEEFINYLECSLKDILATSSQKIEIDLAKFISMIKSDYKKVCKKRKKISGQDSNGNDGLKNICDSVNDQDGDTILSKSETDSKLYSSYYYKFMRFNSRTNNIDLTPCSSQLCTSIYYHKDLKHASCIKFLNDESILLAQPNSIKLIEGENLIKNFISDSNDTEYVNISYDGSLILGGGCSNSDSNPFCRLWKFSPNDHEKNVEALQLFSLYHHMNLMRDNKRVYGLDSNYNAGIIDIETNEIIANFKNADRNVQYAFSLPDMNSDENLILSNAELYCTRSKKLIYVFDQLNFKLSGKFLPSDIDIIINDSLWDIRNFRILQEIPALKKVYLQRTHNPNILFGCEFTKNYNERSSTNQNLIYESNAESLTLHHSSNLETIIKYKFPSVLISCDVSRNCSMFSFIKHESSDTYEDLPSYSILHLGRKTGIKHHKLNL